MMRYTFLLILLTSPVLAQMVGAYSGEPITINPLKPPDGTQMIQILLEQGGSIQLRNTSCGDGTSPNDPKIPRRTVLHILAGNLGSALFEKNRKVNITGRCIPDKFDFPDGVKDIWSCQLRVTETTKKGSYIANGDLDFGITRDTWKIIPEAFMCS